jgi:hypothetical protein
MSLGNRHDPSTILLTPYYRAASLEECQDQPRDANYNPYNLFCLQTRLLPYTQGKPISFSTIEDFEAGMQIMRIVIVLDKMDKEEQESLQNRVGEILGENPNYCALYNTHTVLFSGRTTIPKQWVRSILPYLQIPSEYNPYIVDGLLLVDLSQELNYDDIHQELTISVVDQLRSSFEDGTLVCSEQFAQQWQLDYIADGLYQASWDKPRIIQHKTKFLLDRLHKLPWIRLYIKTTQSPEEEQSTWHTIMEELNKINFPLDALLFTGCGIIISSYYINNLQDLLYISSIFYNAWLRSNFFVEIIPVATLESAQELSRDNSVIYRTGDRLRPYTVSYK